MNHALAGVEMRRGRKEKKNKGNTCRAKGPGATFKPYGASESWLRRAIRWRAWFEHDVRLEFAEPVASFLGKEEAADLHHYLRMLDVPIPVIYGPSADENPFA